MLIAIQDAREGQFGSEWSSSLTHESLDSCTLSCQ